MEEEEEKMHLRSLEIQELSFRGTMLRFTANLLAR